MKLPFGILLALLPAFAGVAAARPVRARAVRGGPVRIGPGRPLPTPAEPAATEPATEPGLADPAEALARNGVEPTTAGVLQFLRRWKPDADARAAVAAAVRQLGSDDFEAREQASRRLEGAGVAAVGALREAAGGDDPEAAGRAGELLTKWERGEQRRLDEDLLDAATRWLCRSPSPAAVPVLLDVIPALPNPWDRDAAAEALWACAGPGDAGRLRSAVDGGNPAARAAAIPALDGVSPDGSAEALRKFLNDPDERVRLSAARALLDRLPESSTAALIDLLASADADVRLQAGWLLQQATGIPPENGDVGLDSAAKRWKGRAVAPGAGPRAAAGRGRLRAGRFAVILSDAFPDPAEAVRGAYRGFRYESDTGGTASVKDGVLRLDGNHPEGDQRLSVAPGPLLGRADFPRHFRIKAKVGGEADDPGAWHAGVSVGNVRLLFHPGYDGGAFRAERVDDRKPFFANDSMPFTPAGGVLYDVTIDVERLDGGAARLAVTIADPTGGARPYRRTLTAQAADLGGLDRIALERSGRRGGAALFGGLTIRIIPSDDR